MQNRSLSSSLKFAQTKGSPCQGSGGVVTVNRCIYMGTNANTQGFLSLRGFAPPPSSEGGLGVCGLVADR